MKLTKMLGLAVAAAMAVMAMAGVSSALATNSTSLCKVNEDVCKAANQYPKGTVISGTTGSTHTSPEEWAQLTTKLGNVHCNSTVSGTTTSANGTEPAGIGIAGEITALNWTLCRFGNPTTGEKCTVTTKNLPYTGVFTNTATNKGTLTVSPPAGKKLGAFVECGEIINCLYTVTGSVTLAAEGGVSGMAAGAGVGFIEANKITLVGEEGKACPTATWDAKYLLESPSPVYLQT